jgi:hypothetical protein
MAMNGTNTRSVISIYYAVDINELQDYDNLIITLGTVSNQWVTNVTTDLTNLQRFLPDVKVPSEYCQLYLDGWV